MEAAGLTVRETVIVAYCGIGTIGIIASQKAGKVIGVELNSDAVRDAVSNARQNKVENIQFYTNDASQFMRKMAEKGQMWCSWIRPEAEAQKNLLNPWQG